MIAKSPIDSGDSLCGQARRDAERFSRPLSRPLLDRIMAEVQRTEMDPHAEAIPMGSSWRAPALAVALLLAIGLLLAVVRHTDPAPAPLVHSTVASSGTQAPSLPVDMLPNAAGRVVNMLDDTIREQQWMYLDQDATRAAAFLKGQLAVLTDQPIEP